MKRMLTLLVAVFLLLSAGSALAGSGADRPDAARPGQCPLALDSVYGAVSWLFFPFDTPGPDLPPGFQVLRVGDWEPMVFGDPSKTNKKKKRSKRKRTKDTGGGTSS